jgi:Uma2 family endonuclease
LAFFSLDQESATEMATASFLIPEQPETVAQRFLLRAVEWQTYRTISEALSERHVRLTFDRGNLEFMTISYIHGSFSRLLGRFIVVLTEEQGLPIRSGGDMTCDREDLDRGLEPDECFYIDNEPLVRHKEVIDLTSDPAPDLAVEIDISRSSRDRMGIYAALGISEVWCFDGEQLRVHVRTADGIYALTERSPHFPFLALQEVAAFLRRRTEMDENSLVRAFRDWVREQIAKSEKKPSRQ